MPGKSHSPPHHWPAGDRIWAAPPPTGLDPRRDTEAHFLGLPRGGAAGWAPAGLMERPFPLGSQGPGQHLLVSFGK